MGPSPMKPKSSLPDASGSSNWASNGARSVCPVTLMGAHDWRNWAIAGGAAAVRSGTPAL
jgi:hypothetical protein